MGGEFTGPVSRSRGFQSLDMGTGLSSSLTSYCKKLPKANFPEVFTAAFF